MKAAALGAVFAVAVSTTAAAQQGNAYGLGQPATVADLRAGPFRSALEALSAPARGRAMAILQGGEFTNGDLPYLRVDRRGGVFFEEPIWASGEADEVPPPPAEISEANAFTLHSKPGAAKTIYIDFDGHVVAGTAWNAYSGYPSHPMKPYDTNGDTAVWTAGELDVVADVWRRIAEDFAPYDVDVTTEEPAVFNSNVGHILVTRKIDFNGNPIFVCGCGGVAYVGVFGNQYYAPALVFQDGVGGTHNTSEAASHEMGHNLNLYHDGKLPSTGYYTGHGPIPVDWAPIMGVGYSRNLTQWSKGEYSGANNFEDDLQKISFYLPYRTDDHEDITLPLATPLLVTGGVNVVALGRVSDPAAADLANKGIIEDRNDIDLFSLDVGVGLIDLTITPGYFEEFTGSSRNGMNLDIEALLLDELGNVLQTSNPDLETGAQITYAVTVAGRYYLEISGVGRGDPLGDGYTDYASLSQYYISGTVPEDVTSSDPPTAPDNLIALLFDDVNIDLDWTDPPSIAETNEAGYRVLRSVNGEAFALRANLPRNSVSYSDNNLANNSYAYKLELYNSAGTTQTAATAPIEVTAPVVAVATSESSAAGSVQSGSYLDTQVSAGSEQLKEQHSGGKPSGRVSSLDHSWNITGVVPAATVTLYLRASAPANSEGDDFEFSYSVGGGSAQPIGTAPNGSGQQIWIKVLPSETSGTVVVRVVDTDRLIGNGATNSVTVYEMHVTSAGPAGDLPPVVAISEPPNGTTIEVGTELVFSATVIDEDTGLAASLSWNSDIDGLLGSSASIAATLTLGPHVVTASVTDSAAQPGSDSVSVLVLPTDGMSLTVTGITPSSINKSNLPAGVAVTIAGTGFDASSVVTFRNGSGPTPSATNITLENAGTLNATIFGSSGGPKKPRVWDVVVTNSGGASAACVDCLTIITVVSSPRPIDPYSAGIRSWTKTPR